MDVGEVEVDGAVYKEPKWQKDRRNIHLWEVICEKTNDYMEWISNDKDMSL